MAIQNWSDNITVVELGDDPQFTEDLSSAMEAQEAHPTDVVLNFASVSFINSSNVAKLLRLRKLMLTKKKKLVLCDVGTQVWGVLLTTGLDKIFDYTRDIATSLASLQLQMPAGGKGKK
jgi:anti-anti-sigma factor